MVGICSALIALGAWLGISWWRRRDIPKTPWFLRATAISGVAAIVALECGWIVTEVGRQPWIVYEVMRTEDAVTQAEGVWVSLGIVLVVYTALGIATVLVLRAMARHWRTAETDEMNVPYGPRPPRASRPRPRREQRRRRSLGALGRRDSLRRVRRGADFAGVLGARGGWWRARRAGARPDRLGDRPGLGGEPRLVDLHAGDPLDGAEAFASVTSTLFIPLSLAAPRIVLRGAGFAFHRVAARRSARRLAEASFAVSSVLTPFFMGTVVGAVASGRVPIGNAVGDPVTSWVNPVSLLLGALFVAMGAYLAAVFLVSDARRFGHPELVGYFASRALAAAFVAGGLALAGVFVLRRDARYLYDGLTSVACRWFWSRWPAA